MVNTCWINRKVPPEWKHSLTIQIPQKGGDPNSPEDWRHIALLLSSYKIYMKLIQIRAMKWIVETKRLSSKQKGSLPRNGLQEHVYELRTSIDNLKHLSSKFFMTFVDIKDAFGSLDHAYMLNVMAEAGYPECIIEITKDIYSGSTFQLVTAEGLTEKITRHKGIIQGCPWSVIAFVQGMDPWIRWVSKGYEIPYAPNPCQAYIDDVVMVATSEKEITEMTRKTEQFMQYTGMQIKHRKCALLHGQRSGNNWYPKSRTHQLDLTIQGEALPKYTRKQSYRYLGHDINLDASGSDQQLREVITTFDDNLKKISDSPLPATAKLQAVNTILNSKLNFYYCNLMFPEKTLLEFENKLVRNVRVWLGLNDSVTRSFMFLPNAQGGLGLIKPSSVYHRKKVTFLLDCLNSDDQQTQFTAHNALHLHMSKRKVPLSDDEDISFAGYKLLQPGKLAKVGKVNWGHSDFVNLCELCDRLGISLVQSQDGYRCVIPQDENIEFSSTDHRAVYSILKKRSISKDMDNWKALINQGNLANKTIPHADMKLSCQHLVNLDINERLVQFVVKGRLQVLETSSMMHIYYPDVHSKSCPSCNHPSDTTSHALNGCMRFRNLYIERHDRSVDHIFNELQKTPIYQECELLKNKMITNNLFHGADSPFDITNNKPDIVIIDHATRTSYVIEISNPYDSFLDICYNSKFIKYMPLCLEIQNTGYQCTIIVLIIGSLGHVHKRYVSGLKKLGIPQFRAKAIAKYLSISTMIGSFRVWRRRWR